ncbi:MAG: PEP/pyruvate-binding domain-containing protein [Patescibacteria group bacterium]|nr:PEP/pyruvate-binding domain-containing protein [Patescibacteria group bacterium]
MDNIKAFKDISKGDVDATGGKGASLGEMVGAGFPVPSGFVVTAAAFNRFLEETDLTQEIKSQLANVNYDDVSSVDRASRVINNLIHDARFPKDLSMSVMEVFEETGMRLVAVRSSATAEDSSVASWAGELESYLNTNEETLLGNVKKCWASLFTPRAIVYRNEKGMRNTSVSVAVVVQEMVQSEVAGVAFTVHPVTKDANQMIIEACWGLGELLVGGLVTPDSYVIDKRDGTIIDINVSEQVEMLTRGSCGNDTVSVEESKRRKQKLDGNTIAELAELCGKIEEHYGFPCDIEWAFADGKFHIVQSRPITTL